VLTQLLSAPSRAQACGQQVPGGPTAAAAKVASVPKLRSLR
jgi:hypothetical protein